MRGPPETLNAVLRNGQSPGDLFVWHVRRLRKPDIHLDGALRAPEPLVELFREAAETICREEDFLDGPVDGDVDPEFVITAWTNHIFDVQKASPCS